MKITHAICQGCKHHLHPIGETGYLMTGRVSCHLTEWNGLGFPLLSKLKRNKALKKNPNVDDVPKECLRWMEYVVLTQEKGNENT